MSDLRLGFTAYELPGVTVFSKRAVEYLMGGPPWYRRLYYWWKDTTSDLKSRLHRWRHKKYFRRVNRSRFENGEQCIKCGQWLWRYL